MRSKFIIIALGAAVMAGLILPPTKAEAAPTGCLPASLKHTISQLKRKFGRIRIISTHRAGAVIAGSGRRSYHASCRAIDFHPPRGKYKSVVRWLKAHHRGGVGTYSCGMHHIHIDSGPKVKWHKCQGSG